MRTYTSLFVLLVLVSCKTTKDATKTVDLNNVSTSKDAIVFSLMKGACFGTCPVYTLKIYNNRYVEYIGKENTERLGTYGKMLDKSSYKSLVGAFDEADFYSFQNVYESNIADLPQIIISYTKDGMTKTVAGKRERPEALHKLQFQLEKIVESNDGWELISHAKGPEKEEKIDKSKIIVDIAKGSQLSRWFSTLKDKFGVQILQKLSDNSDSWLIGINPKLHNPDDVLLYLNSDPVVKAARFKVEMVEN